MVVAVIKVAKESLIVDEIMDRKINFSNVPRITINSNHTKKTNKMVRNFKKVVLRKILTKTRAIRTSRHLIQEDLRTREDIDSIKMQIEMLLVL